MPGRFEAPVDETNRRAPERSIFDGADPLAETIRIPAVRAAALRQQTILTVHVVGGRDLLKFATLAPGESILVGRDDSADLRLTDGTVSKRHLRIRHAGGDTATIEDLGSTNGTRFGGQPVVRATIRLEDEFEVGTVLLRLDKLTLERVAHQGRVVERLAAANRDPLTRLLTRAFLEGELPALIAQARATRRPLSCAFADIDHFKRVNDTFGHQVGDVVLEAVARLIMHGVRDGDPCVRYGGEEVVLFFPLSDEAAAAQISDRIRRAVRGYHWARLASGLAVTVSFGVAELVDHEEMRAWIGRADEALYRAKARGRDQVVRATGA